MDFAGDIYNAHRAEQVSNGPFSESFIVDPAGSALEYRGVFDESFIADNKDQGNVRQKQLKARFTVAEIPPGIVFKQTKLSYDSRNWIIQSSGKDQNGMPVLWLIEDKQ